MKQDDPKANFDNIYAMYSPKAYVQYLVGELGYQLPFQTMAELGKYIQQGNFEQPIQATIIGSAHGLDAVALKYKMTAAEILARWSNEATISQSFKDDVPRGQTQYVCTFIDIEPEPLRFATDVKLADQAFVADLGKVLSPALVHHFRQHSDIIIGTGMISYIGVAGLAALLQAAFVEGKAQLFCFSALKFLEIDVYLAVCAEYGLSVRKIIDAPHRLYKDEHEKQQIKQLLASQGRLSEEDEQGLAGYVFLASQATSPLV